jgi:ribosomal protein S18 acetylase RimI-like enzyme
MSDYTVRPALIADWPTVADITRRCELDVPGVPDGVWTGVVLVAEHPEDGIVGFVQCLPGAPDCVVTTLAVLPGHRKRGVAHQLAAGLEYVLKGLGYHSWVAYIRDGRDDGWRDSLKKWGTIESPIQGFFHRRTLPA